MKIDFILNHKSQYKVLNSFESGLHQAFAKRGVEIIEHDYDYNLYYNLANSLFDYTLGVNVVLPEDTTPVPHIAYFVDWVTYYPRLFTNKKLIVCNIDKHSCQVLEEFGLCQTIFLPHAISQDAIVVPNKKRDIDILFCGSYINDEPELEILYRNLSEGFITAIEKLMSEVMSSTNESHVHKILRLFEAYPEYGEELQKKNMEIFELCNKVEKILRARDRVSLLQAIDGEVHVYGNNSNSWKIALRNKDKCICHTGVDFTEILELFQRSKIVLNSVPTLKEGLHERILNALAGGASVITNRNHLLPQYFSENRALATFIPPEYPKVNSIIKDMLSDENLRLQDIIVAQETIRLHHTWDQRIDQLLSILQSGHGQKAT